MAFSFVSNNHLYIKSICMWDCEDCTLLCTCTTDHEPLQPLLPDTFTSAFQPLSTHSRPRFSQSSAHTISCEQILQLSTSGQFKHYLNLSESWPQYSVQVFIFISGSNHFARSTCGSAPQTECIFSASTGTVCTFQDEYVCMWYVCNAF